MSDRVIYYPYINVPRSEWFSRAVLYWDEIGCILPSGYEPRGHPTRGRPAVQRYAFTSELAQCGLVKFVDPDLALFEIPDFVDDFVSLLDRSYVISPDDALDPRHSISINVHEGKLGPEVFDALASRGLVDAARRQPGGWIPVERTTAELYVAYLAARLGALPQLQMTPITDERESLKAFLDMPGVLPADGAEPAVEVREVLLEALLPAPTHAEPRELAAFKQGHEQQLRRLRRRVEREVRGMRITRRKSGGRLLPIPRQSLRGGRRTAAPDARARMAANWMGVLGGSGSRWHDRWAGGHA